MEHQMDAELRFHLETYAEELMRKGLARDEAWRRARIEFGSVEATKEDCRDARGTSLVVSFFQDLRFAVRILRKNPGFSAVIVLTLALAIGANTAIFTLINAVLWKMLPVEKPEQLTLLEWEQPYNGMTFNGSWNDGTRWIDGTMWKQDNKSVGTSFSYPAFHEIRAHNQVFSDVFAFAELGNHMNVVVDGDAGLAHGEMASGNIFRALGIRATVGRLFDDSDDRPDATPVCVISASYWKRRFGSDPGIAGKHVTIAGAPFTIVGVSPPEFFGVEPGSFVEIWVPLATQPLVAPNRKGSASLLTAADHWWLLVMGRLKPDVSVKTAQAELEVIFHAIAVQGIVPQAGKAKPATVIPTLALAPGSAGLQELQRRFSQPLFMLMGLVGVVLLIACANVANLLLARATSRAREIGVRLSLGASRGRLIRQLLTESLLLVIFGGAFGYLLAIWGSHLLLSLISPPSDPLLLQINPDIRVLLFTAAVCICTGLLFGVAPAYRSTRSDLTTALKQSLHRHGEGGLRIGFGKALIVGQVALSLLLLFAAGLFVRTLVNLRSVDPGFDRNNVLVFGLNPTKSGYKESALSDFYDLVQRSLSTLPGVVSASASYHVLVHDGARWTDLLVPGYVPKAGEDMSVLVLPAAPGFLATMKIPLLRGRDFTERDNEQAPKVVVINEAFAKLYFGATDPVGRHIGLDEAKVGDTEIIGLAKDAEYFSLREPPSSTVYQPIRQAKELPYMYFEVRTAAADPLTIVPSVRTAVAAIDPNIPLFGISTQSRLIDEALLQERMFAKLTGLFGVVALALACVGLYGMLSYAVSRRVREIGIRMALGAKQIQVLRMVMRESLVLIVAGLGFGIPASLFAAHFASGFISDVLFGLKPSDAAAMASAGGLLLFVALFAGYLPARRATRVDPMVALRYE